MSLKVNISALSTKILEDNLFAFAYRLFHEDFSSIDGQRPVEKLPIKRPILPLVIPEYIRIARLFYLIFFFLLQHLTMEQRCIFESRYECDEKTSLSTNTGTSRIETIISASKVYDDTLHKELQTKLDGNKNLKIFFHRNCVSRYTSKSNLIAYNKNETDSSPPVKKLRKSSAFDFRFHCLFCGEACEVNKDPKNPQRWKPAYMCRSIWKDHGSKNYKEYLLEKCISRSDYWADEVRGRIESAVSDLHAADARYHRYCMSAFMNGRFLSESSNNQSTLQREDKALHHIIKTLHSDRSVIWNSVELFELYRENNGCSLTRYDLIKELKQHFGDDLVVLTSQGYASIITFHKNAVHMLKIVKDEDESDHIDKSISILSKQVVQECNSISCDKSSFQVHIDADITAEHASDTLLKLLAALSKRLDRTLPALLIANIITSVLRNSPTPLQVALGILLRDSKAVISHMYDYRVTCSYDEVLRFKSSAAVAASTNPANQGISDAKDGLIQIVADNFNSDISSPNGKLSTHSMAMIVMQPTRNSDKPQCETIPRLKKNEVPKTLMDEQDYYSQNFIHRKKPSMPALTTSNLSPEILHHQEIS